MKTCSVCGAESGLPLVNGLRRELPSDWTFVLVAVKPQVTRVLCRSCTQNLMGFLRPTLPAPAMA